MQVAAGREGVLPHPLGGRKACRDCANCAEFGIGAEQVPTTAREAGRRARGPRRRAKASGEEESKEEVVLDPVPPFLSVLRPLGGALGEAPAMAAAAAHAESADRVDGALDEHGAFTAELRETRARPQAAAGAAEEASAAIAEAEGRAQARAEERDGLALAEVECRLQDRAEERDRLALALEDVRGRYAAALENLVGPSVGDPKSNVAEAGAAMEPALVPADVGGEEFQGIDRALDLSKGPSFSDPSSRRRRPGVGGG
ncbi:unnamed protein product [Prorocentrum cordatum]|uniref:Uncharacterized protein n=1 Tax=Prorocentrum cordatum TaxID=2364126 RepID=A0ABN9TE36_9DINO|nr:unnamed protein product [Polarella glacialis]